MGGMKEWGFVSSSSGDGADFLKRNDGTDFLKRNDVFHPLKVKGLSLNEGGIRSMNKLHSASESSSFFFHMLTSFC